MQGSALCSSVGAVGVGAIVRQGCYNQFPCWGKGGLEQYIAVTSCGLREYCEDSVDGGVAPILCARIWDDGLLGCPGSGGCDPLSLSRAENDARGCYVRGS